jgi:hypothetical protein
VRFLCLFLTRLPADKNRVHVDEDEYLLKALNHTATPPTTTKGNYFSFIILKNDEKLKDSRYFFKYPPSDVNHST